MFQELKFQRIFAIETENSLAKTQRFLSGQKKNYDGIPRVEALKNRKNPDEYWDYILEEAVAELHSSYKNSPEVSDQVDGTSGLLDKVRRFFERVYNSVTGVGYGDAGDVFAAIGKGTIGGRKRGEIRTFKTGPKYASVDQLARPRSERERRDSDLNETRGGVAVNVEEDETKKSLVPPPLKYNSSVQINGDWSDMILNRKRLLKPLGSPWSRTVVLRMGLVEGRNRAVFWRGALG